jgi:hypothetical protein
MLSRVLSVALAAAWVAAAVPAHAYDPADPSGPPPDDPAAWAQQPATTHVARDLKRCDMMFGYAASRLTADDPAYATERGPECSCDMRACAGTPAAPRTESGSAAVAESPG